MQAELHADSELFEFLSKSGDNYIFIEDPKNGWRRWSENAAADFLLPGEDTVGPAFWKALIWHEDFPLFEKEMQRMNSGAVQRISGEYRLNTRDGYCMWTHLNIGKMQADAQSGYIAGIITGMASRNLHDPVTGLRGEYDFREALKKIGAMQEHWGVMLFGIDSFQRINNLHSYSLGDRVLREFAEKLLQRIPEKASLFRLDGGKFGMICPEIETGDLIVCFSRFREIVQQPFQVDGTSVSFTISGAVCRSPDDGSDGESLYRNIRIAFHTSKARGENQFTVFTSEISQKERRRLLLLERLRESVGCGFGGFSLNYQPLILANTGKLYGCEVLLRWSHPDFPEGVSPDEFIPILETSGLMPPVGKWVVKSAFEQGAGWTKQMPDFHLSLNVTCAQFEDPAFRFFMMDSLAHAGLKPSCITLELTESSKISNPQEISHAFDFFRSQGIRIAFDDFGTGYASLEIFRVLSADELKIDRSFLERITYDVTDQKIVGEIINLCDSMNMSVCVKGIESPEVARVVSQLGTRLLQGYYYNRPLSAGEFQNCYFSQESVAPLLQHFRENQSLVCSEFRPAQTMSGKELLDHVNAGIIQVGIDETFTFLGCNEGYRRLLGYTAKQMEEKFRNRALAFIHEDDREYAKREIRRQLGQGDMVTLEVRVVKSNGDSIWVLGSGNVVKGRSGNASLTIVIQENDRIKKRSLRLEKNCRMYRNILYHLPNAVLYTKCNSGFSIDYISPGFLSLLGYTEHEINRKFQYRYVDLIAEADRPGLMNGDLEKLKAGQTVTQRYRVRRKDAGLIWIETLSRLCPPEGDGLRRCVSSVVGVGDQESRGLDLSGRYQLAAEQWGDILFECDFLNGTILFSDNYSVIFGREPKSSLEEELRTVYREDQKNLLHVLRIIREGSQPDPIEVRVLAGKDRYIWCSVYFNKPGQTAGRPLVALGKICSIDAERREKDKLLARLQRDPLTGLYNKGALEDKIRQALETLGPAQSYLLFMIDVDDFKQVNDTFGHLFGDKLLAEVADRLRRFFRREDIAGRAGGDEFMVFMRFDEDLWRIGEIGADLRNALGRNISFEGKQTDVSVSIGIARCPEDGVQFYDLFRHADSALYQAKERGKNGYCVYSR